MTKTTKPTQATPATTRKVGTNSTKLPFPRDYSGATSELRRGGVRAIGRIMGSEDNLERVLETLEVLKAYAVERCAEQVKEMEAKKAALEAKAEVQRQLQIAQTKRVLEAKRKEAAKVDTELKALEAASK